MFVPSSTQAGVQELMLALQNQELLNLIELKKNSLGDSHPRSNSGPSSTPQGDSSRDNNNFLM